MNHLTRRTMLRGLGVSMALPWFESLAAWGDTAQPTSGNNEPPLRLGVLFSGNGYHRDEWWAKGAGDIRDLNKNSENWAVVKAASRLVCPVPNLRGANPPSVRRPALIRRRISTLCVVAARRTASR